MKKKPGPKPKTLTEEQRVELRALSRYLTQAQIADYFGFAERTLTNIFEREPDIYAAYKTGAVSAVAKSASLLTKLAWGYTEYDKKGAVIATRAPDRASLMFHLKTKGGWRETNNLEVTGQDGESIKVEAKTTFDVSGLPTEMQRAILGQLKLGEDGLPDESEPD